MLIYLADLAHDYQRMRQYVPLNVGFIASHAYSVFGDRIDIKLFKSPDKLLDAVDARRPDLIGMSNYTWNLELDSFVGRSVKTSFPDLPIIMGGPNIETSPEGVESFLRERDYVDIYCMFAGEKKVSEIIGKLLDLPTSEQTGKRLRMLPPNGCYSLDGNHLTGNAKSDDDKDLDYIPSAYTNHLLDEFLDQGMIPIIETNRGCPYSCSFCFWGVNELNKLKRFSLQRVFADLKYVAYHKAEFSEIYFCDANFGILKRDVEIANYVRELYEQTQSFSSVTLYWSKSAQPHMVDIGRALGHLTTTYVAFQSLDEEVLTAMKRKNINTEKLLHLITSLKEYTHVPQTDILVGSPEETFTSHLYSLDKALEFGIMKINGGEIRMLPGTDMAKPETRDLYGIKTKYRLFEGGIGIYRGQLVYELEETIRQTNAMTEDEMIRLRVLRALFFGSVTLSEHWPLISYLTHNGVRFTPILESLIARAGQNANFNKSIDWLQQQAQGEFFDTPEDIGNYLANANNQDNIFGKNAFLKLNFGYLARLVLNPDEYDAYYQELQVVLNRHTSSFSTPEIISDILKVCRMRNYLVQCLSENYKRETEINICEATIEALQDCGYLRMYDIEYNDDLLKFEIDPVTAKQIRQEIGLHSNDLTYFSVSQIMQMFWGRCHLEPSTKFTIITEPKPVERTTGFVS